MTEILVCPKGALTNRSLKDARAAGIVVIESDDPDRTIFMRAGEVVSGDDLLWAALSALNVVAPYGSTGEKQREAFAVRVFQVVKDRRAVQQHGQQEP